MSNSAAVYNHKEKDANEEVLYVSEFAKKLQVAESTVNNWIKEGKIPKNLYFHIGISPRILCMAFERYYNVNLDNVLTYEQVAAKLRTARGTLGSLFSRGQLPSILKIKIVGTVRFCGDLLDKFMRGELIAEQAA